MLKNSIKKHNCTVKSPENFAHRLRTTGIFKDTLIVIGNDEYVFNLNRLEKEKAGNYLSNIVIRHFPKSKVRGVLFLKIFFVPLRLIM